ncbi:MAG: Eco57I restriction-modification methylase domain-containing protein [Phycisphaerales bacterium JB058]
MGLRADNLLRSASEALDEPGPQSCDVREAQGGFAGSVIEALLMLGACEFQKAENSTIVAAFRAGRIDARGVLSRLSLRVYEAIACRLARERGLTLGARYETDGPRRDLAEFGGLFEPRIAEVCRDPSGVLGASYEEVLEHEPVIDLEGRAFEFRAARSNARQSSGSYYTPGPLVEHVLQNSLEPMLEERLRRAGAGDRAEAVLGLRVCDPACGSGAFLAAAARMLARHAERREVVQRCLYGVDLDPVAALLCRVSLWLEVNDQSLPLEALETNIRVGDALLGTTPELMARGIPDEAMASREGDDKRVAARLRRTNRVERDGVLQRPELDPSDRVVADAWCASFVVKKDGRDAELTDGVFRDVALRRDGVNPGLLERVERLARGCGFFHWHIEFPTVFGRENAGFDVIVGNPPFQNQLSSSTATDAGTTQLHRVLSGGVVSRYADVSTRFLARSLSLCRRGGWVGLVLPMSVLSASDALATRRYAAREASISSVWLATEHVFAGASVYACAVMAKRSGPRRTTLARTKNLPAEVLPSIGVDHDALAEEETWSPLIAAALGIPEFGYLNAGTVGEVAAATADFRDQYYGLDGFLVESEDAGPEMDEALFPPIVTAGMIDLAECRWGEARVRLLKRAWRSPRVDRAAMRSRGTLDPWLTQRLVPKIILATQTRVLEVYVDEAGQYVPSTPLISVVPREGVSIWDVASALASPVSSALSLQRYAGSALSTQAIKLSAKQSLHLPLPVDREAWSRSAKAFRAAQQGTKSQRRALLECYAHESVAAYRVPGAEAGELLRWWTERLKS